tara:strand:- start:2378 stop:2980 length:603 start_codon:yes stop_codon:yes gene_type:complete
MKNKINIFSSNRIKKFLEETLFQYEINYKKIEDINYNNQNLKLNIIILNNDKDMGLINLKNLHYNCLIISNTKINKSDVNKNTKILKCPTSIDHIKNTIENFINNLKVSFHDISIDNEKLTNLNNNSFCYLTKVEFEILCFLISEKETTKSIIKKNILNIKSNVETNSLESHLTRIRKKMNKVKTDVQIRSKNERLLISV